MNSAMRLTKKAKGFQSQLSGCGAEDGSVSKKLTDKYMSVMIPTRNCMNLAVTVNVI